MIRRILLPVLLGCAAAHAAAPTADATAQGALAKLVDGALRRTVKIYGASIAGEHGYGSGVIVSADGTVVTALALLLESSDLRAVTHDGHVYRATVAYRDDNRQLALLKLEGHPQNLDTDAPVREQMASARFEPFALDEMPGVQAGDWVVTIGNPFKVAEGDEPMSIMKGIVSGRAPMDAARGVQQFPYRGEILLLDAITSGPGSAGSAVIDMGGRLVGVTGKPVTSQLTNTLLNYAYPVEEVRGLIRDAAQGKTSATQPAVATRSPGYHGIQLSRIAYRKELPFVNSVARNSPAAVAGVRSDDLIVSANGVAVPRGRVFNELCERLYAGDELSLVVKRGEELVSIRMTLTERPK